jgi:hypothetical protein
MFRELIDQAGGPSAFAIKYRFPISTIGTWYRGDRFPSACNQARLSECTGVDINFTDLRTLYLQKRVALKTRQNRRLSETMLINSMERLKRCFTESDLSPDRLNAQGQNLIARWELANVTVKEFRLAVSMLKRKGQDAENITLLHNTVNAMRRESLRRLDAL